MNSIIPTDSNKAYDIKEVISRIIDSNSFFEIGSDFAKNMVIGFGRMDGNTVAVTLTLIIIIDNSKSTINI